MTTAELRNTFDSLTPDEQLRLVQDLWDRIAQDPARVPVPKSHLDELERRLADYDAAPHDVVEWSDVVAEARSRK